MESRTQPAGYVCGFLALAVAKSRGVLIRSLLNKSRTVYARISCSCIIAVYHDLIGSVFFRRETCFKSILFSRKIHCHPGNLLVIARNDGCKLHLLTVPEPARLYGTSAHHHRICRDSDRITAVSLMRLRL